LRAWRGRAGLISLLKSRFAAGGDGIRPQEEVQRINRGAVLVDVRQSAEFQGGHAPVAQHLPLRGIRSGGIVAMQSLRPPSDTRENLLICQSDMRSKMAQGLLSKDTARTYANVTGGMNAWRGHGLPVKR